MRVVEENRRGQQRTVQWRHPVYSFLRAGKGQMETRPESDVEDKDRSGEEKGDLVVKDEDQERMEVDR